MKTILCPHCGMEIEKTISMNMDVGDICESVRVFGTLRQANLHTMEALHDYIQKNSAEGLTLIKGIGNYTAGIINGFYENFMKTLAEKQEEKEVN